MSEKGPEIINHAITLTASMMDNRPGLGHVNKAVTFAGDIAADGRLACGILEGIARNGETASLLLLGVGKYVANGAITAGARLTPTTSGYMMTAGSGHHVVGRNLEVAVASGAVGRGAFNFINAVDYAQFSDWKSQFTEGTFTPALKNLATADVGKAINVRSGDIAATEGVADGVLLVDATTAQTARYGSVGLMYVRPGSAAIAAGRALKVTSGWFIAAASGDYMVGRLLEASAANALALKRAAVNFGAPSYLVDSVMAGLL